MPTYNSNNIKDVIPGTNGSSTIDNINSTVADIRAAMNSLHARVSEATTQSAIVKHGIPLGQGVFKGALVYYDKTVGAFLPALADLEDNPGPEGEFLEDPRARVEGMVIDIYPGAVSGTLLVAGMWKDLECMQNCLTRNTGTGTVPTTDAGIYYTSPFDVGRAVDDPEENVRQPVISHKGDGEFNLTVILYSHYPFTYGLPVIRDVLGDEGALLDISKERGIVTIATKDPAAQEGVPAPSSTAISKIENGVQYKTPVVSRIVQGPGISAVTAMDGTVTLSLDSLAGNPIDATAYNHNGTSVTSDGLLAFVTFRQGASTSCVMSLPVNDSLEHTASPWCQIYGNSGSLQTSTWFVPLNGSAPTTQTAGTMGGSVGYNVGEAQHPFTGPGLLLCKMTASPSGAPLRLLRSGFVINNSQE